MYLPFFKKKYSLLLHHSKKLRWILLVAFKQSAILCTMDIAMHGAIYCQSTHPLLMEILINCILYVLVYTKTMTQLANGKFIGCRCRADGDN